MADLHAETAYLFRHALLRDAAYQLQMPSRRAKLHGLAVSILLRVFRSPVEKHRLDPAATELARHAKLALADDDLSRSARKKLAATESALLKRGSAYSHAHFDLDSGEYCFKRLAEISLRNPRQHTGAVLGLLSLYQFNGKFLQSTEVAAAALENKRVRGHRRSTALLLTAMGSAQCHLGKLKEGESSLRRAAELAATKHDHELTALVHRGLALHAELTGRYADFLSHMTRTVEAREKLGNEADTLLAVIERATHDELPHAEATLAKAAQDAARLNREDLLAFALLRLGFVQRLLAKPTPAMAALEQARSICDRIGHRHTQLQVLDQLAEINYDHGDAARGERDQLTQVALAVEMNDVSAEAWGRTALSKIYVRRGKLDEAKKQARSAITTLRKLGQRQNLATPLGNLANACLLSKDLTGAQAAYAECLALMREAGSARGEATVHTNLVGVFLEQGQIGRATASARAAIGLCTAPNLRFYAAIGALALARVQLLLGLGTECEKLLNQAKSVLQPMNANEVLAEARHPTSLRLNVSRGEAGQARADCEVMEQTLKTAGSSPDSELGRELKSGLKLVAMAENMTGAIAKGQFNGHLPEDMTPQLRLALLDRLAKLDTEMLASLELNDPELLAAMRAGTENLDIPDWQNEQAP